ncbi:chromatin modification-related protein EAF1-like [Cyclospora cayetanensis]|uniref:Chromatin modification-related protein EAF1-like n=1 Tax=Cyclospora cayetanensis TaxID=88456 RepID=A0A6P6RW14_9EIME|nr:chromatin modification-related protein EAF1-like [Cyclospora cayetanensis]
MDRFLRSQEADLATARKPPSSAWRRGLLSNLRERLPHAETPSAVPPSSPPQTAAACTAASPSKASRAAPAAAATTLRNKPEKADGGIGKGTPHRETSAALQPLQSGSGSSTVRELIELDSEEVEDDEDDDCLFLGRFPKAPETEGGPAALRAGYSEAQHTASRREAGAAPLLADAASSSSSSSAAAAARAEEVSIDSSDDEPQMCGFTGPDAARPALFAVYPQQQHLQQQGGSVWNGDAAAFLWGEFSREESGCGRRYLSRMRSEAASEQDEAAAAAAAAATAVRGVSADGQSASPRVGPPDMRPLDLLPYIVIQQGLSQRLQLLHHQQHLQQQLLQQEHRRMVATMRPQQSLAAGSLGAAAAAAAAAGPAIRRRARRALLPWQRQDAAAAAAAAAAPEAHASEEALQALQQQQHLWWESGFGQQEPQQQGTPAHVLQQLPALPFKSRPKASSSRRSSGSSGSAAREEGGERDKCAICLDLFVEGKLVRFLPCLHFFHASCVDTWLQQSDKCPVCKWPVQNTALPEAEVVA